MRDLVGHKVTMVAIGFPKPMSGTLVNETQTEVHIKSLSQTQNIVWRIPRDKVCGYASLDAPATNFSPFHVLFCDNKGLKCKGVQYIKAGEGFSRADLDVFMSGCPKRSIDCRCGSKGEIRTVASDVLKEMFTGVLFGDYPEGGKEDGRPSTETEPSEGGGRKAGKGRKPRAGGTEQPPETADGIGSQVQG